MPRGADLLGLAASAVVGAAVLLALPGGARLHRARPKFAAVAALAVALVPVGGLPLAGYLRGIVGDLSVTTTVLLLLRVMRPALGLEPMGETSRATLQVSAGALGLALYPLTLGLGPYDPYRLGFGDTRLVGALAALAALALVRRRLWPAALVSLAVLAWAANLGESRNLWDYLVDPPLAAWGLGATALRLARCRLRPISQP
jgi:hypothetical protein